MTIKIFQCSVETSADLCSQFLPLRLFAIKNFVIYSERSCLDIKDEAVCY